MRRLMAADVYSIMTVLRTSALMPRWSLAKSSGHVLLDGL